MGHEKLMAQTAFFKTILKFCTTNDIFVYIHPRYTKQQIAVLNNVVTTKGKIRTLKFSAAFLKACISLYNLKLGPMAEWHKPHEAIHVTVGSIPEST